MGTTPPRVSKGTILKHPLFDFDLSNHDDSTDGDIRNILNPVSILFWTRIVTLPSVDSRVTSVNQPLTPTSSSVLAIIDIPNVTILNHTADTNRNADIPSREGHLTCSGMNNGL